MAQLLLFYFTLFVLGLGLHFVGAAIGLTAIDGDDARSLARKFVAIGLVAAHKPVLTVNTSSELTLKRRSYDEELDGETVTFGGLMSSITRRLQDPRNRLHRFFGVRFAFVEEWSGLVFDPRDADAGHEAMQHQEAGTLHVRGEPRDGRLPQYIRGVFDTPAGPRGVNLGSVVHLIGGSADSQAVTWLQEMYKTSQEPRTESLSTWQLLAPVLALLGVLLFGAFMGGGGGGGGGGSSLPAMPVGGSLFILAAPAGALATLAAYRTQIVVGIGTLLATLFVLGLVSVFPLGVAIPAILSLVAGVLFLPTIAWFLGKSLGALGLGLATLYFILGLKFAYDDPVIYLRENDEYDLVEWAEVEDEASSTPTWYRFAKTWIGVAYENTDDAWPGKGAVLSADKVESYADETAEDGDLVPPGTAVAPTMQSGGHTGFVPTKQRSSEVYLQTRHALAWFRDVGRGGLLLRALKQAKEDHFGGNEDLGKRLQYMTIGFVVLGLFVDFLVFF